MEFRYILQSGEGFIKANEGKGFQKLPYLYLFDNKESAEVILLKVNDIMKYDSKENIADLETIPKTITFNHQEYEVVRCLGKYGKDWFVNGQEKFENEIKTTQTETLTQIKKDVPRITEISYSELVPNGQFANKKFGVKVSVPEGYSPEGVFLKTQEYIKDKLADSNSDLKFENLSAMTLKEKIAEHNNKKLKEENEQLKKELLHTSEKLSRIEEVFKPKSFGDCQEDDDEDEMPPF